MEFGQLVFCGLWEPEKEILSVVSFFGAQISLVWSPICWEDGEGPIFPLGFIYVYLLIRIRTVS